MLLNKTDIINAGLFAIGAKKIFAPSDNTKAARLAESMYNYMREIVFELPYEWHWCTARSEQLAQLADPVSGYNHQYALPDNTIRALSLIDPDTGQSRRRDEPEFSFENGVFLQTAGDNTTVTKVIRTNVEAANAFIKYIVFIEDERMYPAWFAQLISLNLAVYLAEPIKQHTPHYTKIKDMLAAAITFAEEANALTNTTTGATTLESIDKGNDDLVNAGNLGFSGAYPFNYWGL